MRSLFAFFFIVVVMLGCKKNAPEEPTIQDEPTPNPSSLDLIAGDTSGMVVSHYSDTVRSEMFTLEHLYIDLDGVPGNDITILTHRIWPAQTTSPPFYAWIRNLRPELRFIGHYATDTLKQQTNDSTIIYQPQSNGIDWIAYVNRTRGCGLTGASEIIQITTNNFRPTIHGPGTVIDTLASLPIDSISLRHGDLNYHPPTVSLNDSTSLSLNVDYLYSSCFQIPDQEIFYIGFILDASPGPRNGFLCLEMMERGVIVHYTAIEP